MREESQKSPEMQKVLEYIGMEVYGKSLKECLEKGLCIQCGEEALTKCYSEAGRKEFRISGLCEVCWDEVMNEDD